MFRGWCNNIEFKMVSETEQDAYKLINYNVFVLNIIWIRTLFWPILQDNGYLPCFEIPNSCTITVWCLNWRKLLITVIQNVIRSDPQLRDFPEQEGYYFRVVECE